VAAVGGEEQAAAVGGEEQATADSPWRGGRGCREGRRGSGGALCFFFTVERVGRGTGWHARQ
jgi:hypothetical protein